MTISTEEEYNTLEKDTDYNYYCSVCNEYCTSKKSNRKKTTQLLFLCNVHLKRHAQLKREQTNLKKYGSKCPLGSPIVREKFEHTMLEKYNTVHALQNKDLLQKVKETTQNKYNVENISQLDSVKKKKQQKLESTNILKYGVKNVFQNEEVKQKIRDKKRSKYGTVCVSRNYCFQGNYFDSSWELSFFIYCIDHNISVKRNPCTFQYEYQDKAYHYEVDFQIPCGYVEIKGDQFFNERNELICPFDKSQEAQEKAKAKHQCMKDNNVIVLREKDLQDVFNYIESTYDKDYLKTFIVTKKTP